MDLNEKTSFGANMNVKISPDMLRAAHKKAKESGFTLSQIVRILLLKWINDPDMKIKL